VKLFRDAEAALGLNLRRSYWVGDRVSDLSPANTLGGRGLLVETGRGAMQVGKARALGFTVVPDLAAAAATILRSSPAPPPTRSP